MCVDLPSGRSDPSFASALSGARNPKSSPAGTIEEGRANAFVRSGIDNFAGDVAAVVPYFINSEYAHWWPRDPSSRERGQELPRGRREKEEQMENREHEREREREREREGEEILNSLRIDAVTLCRAPRVDKARQDARRKRLKSGRKADDQDEEREAAGQA